MHIYGIAQKKTKKIISQTVYELRNLFLQNTHKHEYKNVHAQLIADQKNRHPCNRFNKTHTKLQLINLSWML